jgi:E3 ubiquitin-protein ligase DOA10
MEQVCRICYEPEDSDSQLLTPCECRGTSAYIHEACLVRYLDYYPDGVCRVCLVKMRVQIHPEVGTALAALMLSFIILNNAAIPLIVKFSLLVTTGVLIRGLGTAGLLSVRFVIVLTGMTLMLIAAQHDIRTLIAINMMALLVGTLMTLGLYVEMEGVMACAVAAVAYVYAVFMIIRILFEMDVWTNIAAMNIMFMGWYAWYMSRQPLFAPVPF